MPLRRDLVRWSFALLRAGGAPPTATAASRLFDRARRLAARVGADERAHAGHLTIVTAALVSATLALRAQDGDDHDAPALIRALIGRALAPAAQAPFRSSGFVTTGDLSLPRSVLYRGLLVVGLAGLERLHPDHGASARFDAIATSLIADLERGERWLPTYGEGVSWPGDHAPAAAGLVLHGTLRGWALSATHGQRLVARIAHAAEQELSALPGLALPFLRLVDGLPDGNPGPDHEARFSGLCRLQKDIALDPLAEALYVWARTARSWTEPSASTAVPA